MTSRKTPSRVGGAAESQKPVEGYMASQPEVRILFLDRRAQCPAPLPQYLAFGEETLTGGGERGYSAAKPAKKHHAL